MNAVRNVFNTVRKSSPILLVIVSINLFITVVCMIALMVDDRMLTGVNVWIKPLKFAISGAIYTLTVGFLITLYPFSKLKKNIINNLTSWTLLFEVLIITYQAARGVRSHYNQSSVFDGILFAMMGLLIAINVLIMVLFAFETIRLKLNTARSVQWAILIGWIVVLVGSWVGGQMIGQMSHNVGIADGGEGLPLVNWSTVAGDLRVAHFFGLHGIQIIPLFALWLSTGWKAPKRSQMTGAILFGLFYAGWVGYIFWQAKQAMPFLSL
ncbi:MAG: hypothetical protein AAFX87_10400 [Bacteroidota bacterium]